MINGDDEKINNIAKMLNSEMNKRKKLFMSYNGNYQDYIKLSGQTLPNIVVVINSIEILTEVYQEYTEKIIAPIREGSKYGIYFVIIQHLWPPHNEGCAASRVWGAEQLFIIFSERTARWT